MSPSILIVDDESVFLDSVVRMLRIEGYDDFTAMEDSTKVPDLLANKSFDVAFLDITMPQLDGLELLKIIKRRSPRTECIMVTAHESVPLVIKAIKIGAYDYLVKPITPEQMAHALERALEHKQLLEAHARKEELEHAIRAAEEARKELLLQEARKREEVLRKLEVAHRELQEAQAQLVQSEKMAALGQLVAGVTHEVNTPLGAICSASETLVRALRKLDATLDQDFPGARQSNDKLNTSLQTIEDGARVIETGSERVAEIIARLRTFARLDEADFKLIDLHQGIEDVLVLLRHQLPEEIRITKGFGQVPPIPCYPRQLNQVLLNLLINARQAIEAEGEIRITTSAVEDSEVRVVIRDSGAGIPAENLEKIFDPGFTTRGVGVGAGLGLAICYRIIKKHRGEILVQSEVGRGTAVTVILPTNLQSGDASGMEPHEEGSA